MPNKTELRKLLKKVVQKVDEHIEEYGGSMELDASYSDISNAAYAYFTAKGKLTQRQIDDATTELKQNFKWLLKEGKYD